MYKVERPSFIGYYRTHACFHVRLFTSNFIAPLLLPLPSPSLLPLPSSSSPPLPFPPLPILPLLFSPHLSFPCLPFPQLLATLLPDWLGSLPRSLSPALHSPLSLSFSLMSWTLNGAQVNTIESSNGTHVDRQRNHIIINLKHNVIIIMYFNFDRV